MPYKDPDGRSNGSGCIALGDLHAAENGDRPRQLGKPPFSTRSCYEV